MSKALIFGRDAELAQLNQLLAQHVSFLLHGPAGVGKSFLIRHLAGEQPALLYCPDSASGQTVFRSTAVGLLARKNPRLVSACRSSGVNAIKEKSAVSLRGFVTEALRGGTHTLVLDHIQSPSRSFASAVKDLCTATDTVVVAVARSAHMEDAGFLLPMFADRSQKYALRNFDSSTANTFAAQAAQKMQLDVANREDVISKIVLYSKGNPGAILAMLKMASNPKYVAQRHVKLSPLYIDFRLSAGVTHG
ncbi:MAG TPA: ATP-binding protein [Terriglobales bacterium]